MHFPLHPETPLAGRSLADLFAGRGYDLDAMHERMKAAMDAEGLAYSPRSHTYNSRFAQELGKWADTQAGGEAIHDAMYKAYFVDTENVADFDVLVNIAGKVGLDTTSARAVLETRSFSDAVDADWARSQQAEVTGVPTFAAAGMAIVGAQPYPMLERLINKALEKRAKSTSG